VLIVKSAEIVLIARDVTYVFIVRAVRGAIVVMDVIIALDVVVQRIVRVVRTALGVKVAYPV
jgi:hypothetical protein